MVVVAMTHPDAENYPVHSLIEKEISGGVISEGVDVETLSEEEVDVETLTEEPDTEAPTPPVIWLSGASTIGVELASCWVVVETVRIVFDSWKIGASIFCKAGGIGSIAFFS